MSYMEIQNLYKDQTILMFKQVWVTEKIHGTSAWVTFDRRQNPNKLLYHCGGGPPDKFPTLFDEQKIYSILDELFGDKVVRLHGEYYGGKINKMSHAYGDSSFALFDIKVNDTFLSFDNVISIGDKLGLYVVESAIVDATVEVLNEWRDKPSALSIHRGITTGFIREGIVIHPLKEFTMSNGDRVIAKHKGESFKETATNREITSEKQQALEDAIAVANEWVTPMRLNHVLDKFPNAQIEQTGKIIIAMVEDVEKESKGEIIWNQDTKKEIGKATSKLFREYLQSGLK